MNTNELMSGITHELAHVHTLSNGVTSTPVPLGVAHLYFYSLEVSGSPAACIPYEFYADALTYLVHGAPIFSSYFTLCSGITDSLIEEAVAVVRSAVSGTIPSWFATTYNDSNGDPDLERVWALVRAIPGNNQRAAVVFQLRDAFGGYCDNQKATDAAFGSEVTRNPWNDGGCVPEAPGSVTATAVGGGTLTVSWQVPPDDGGSPIQGYRVQWKSGTQEYDSSRQAVVTSLTDLRHTIGGLTNDESHTLRVLAYNNNGDGAATEAMATPKATATTAPALLAARVDGATLRLTWSEALDQSSEPATSAFTVNVGGVARTTDQVSVSGNTVTLMLTYVVQVSDSVTVAYATPTGSTANPLRDAAENNAADFPGQSVRNDTTQVAITSDPGTVMTYILRNGHGHQDVIEAMVTFSQSVVVTGVPELILQVGESKRVAAYRSGTGTSALVFRYMIAEGELDSDGVSVPAGAIQTSRGVVRYLSTKYTVPAQVELAAQSAHLVDAVRPVLLSANGLANRSVLTLTWDKALDEDSMPTPRGAGFRVRDTSENAYRDISAISVLGTVVTVTLSSSLSATDQITVSYGVPFRTNPPLKDTLGNYAGSNSAVVSITQRPNSEPEFPTSEDGARSVDENTPANRNIGAPIQATDADNDALTYSISGTEAASFDVVTTSGQLRTKAALNREFRDSYTFTMSVHDGKDVHGNADATVDDTISVTVTVADDDEPADISFSPTSGSPRATTRSQWTRTTMERWPRSVRATRRISPASPTCGPPGEETGATSPSQKLASCPSRTSPTTSDPETQAGTTCTTLGWTFATVTTS